jgi:hypothetical protein
MTAPLCLAIRGAACRRIGGDGGSHRTRGMIKATRQQIASRTPLLQDPQWRGRARVMDKWIEIAKEIVGRLKRRLHILEQAFNVRFPASFRFIHAIAVSVCRVVCNFNYQLDRLTGQL